MISILTMNRIFITIPLNPVTKKNSGRIVGSGKLRLIPSKAYMDYERDCGFFIGGDVRSRINTPVEVTCKFYMRTRRRVDLVNLLNAIDDVLVHYGVIADDNSDIIISHDGSRVYYDKNNPRTEVDIHEIET